MQAVSLRLPRHILDAVDECAADLQDQTPLLEVTRTDALRYLIQRGLADFATKGAANSKRKGG
ncbi:hypothetical protein GCM10023325_20450 [Sphingomonas lutea]